jgi:hypothetical protein
MRICLPFCSLFFLITYRQTSIETSGGIVVKLEDDVNESNWIKLLVFLYTGDTDIISDDPTDLQICLNACNSYCRQWESYSELEQNKSFCI